MWHAATQHYVISQQTVQSRPLLCHDVLAQSLRKAPRQLQLDRTTQIVLHRSMHINMSQCVCTAICSWHSKGLYTTVSVTARQTPAWENMNKASQTKPVAAPQQHEVWFGYTITCTALNFYAERRCQGEEACQQHSTTAAQALEAKKTGAKINLPQCGNCSKTVCTHINKHMRCC